MRWNTLPPRRRTGCSSRGVLVEHAADVVRQVDIHELMRDVGDRPAAVAGNEIEDRRHRRREAADDQVAVEEHRGDLRALEQVAQVARWLRSSSSTLPAQLGVDGVQLLVDGLQLLLGGLQLLVGGLQLLVDRDQLLVGGLQLLERRLVFLDGRLQALARFAQLVLQAGARRRRTGAAAAARLPRESAADPGP